MAQARPHVHPIDPATVKGWGVDVDPRNDPTYPYRIRAEEGGRPMDWPRPPLQEQSIEILRSIEHNRLPAVIGTSVPPRGLSGAIRRVAFTYSESDWRHWLMLLGADRVNMAEGILGDLSRGRVPDIPREMGLRAEWRHNKAGLIQKVVFAASVTATVWALCRKTSRSTSRRGIKVSDAACGRHNPGEWNRRF